MTFMGSGMDKDELVSPRQTSIQVLRQGFFVEMLPDEDEFLHAVAVGVVPVAAEGGLSVHEGL